MIGSRIAAVGHYQPARVLTNEDLAGMVDTSDAWITSRVGIRTRHIAGPDEPVDELAAHAAFVDWSEGVLRLSLPAADDHLKTEFLVSQLSQALAPRLGATPQIRFDESAGDAGETLHVRDARQRDARQTAAEQAFLSDPQVQRLMQQQGARLVPDSIRPYEEG